ncbi:hypothetical protein BDZ89DRAFT_1131996 [Hymenopellis radicata]|nr:hypothetical protein BDZ89DRAFT_1148222 [Hymenopellis radicata]KAF9031274.1 hypothetical protein BDZ89DRAFT_1131996 [Hymenopellis radicata]
MAPKFQPSRKAYVHPQTGLQIPAHLTVLQYVHAMLSLANGLLHAANTLDLDDVADGEDGLEDENDSANA